MSHAVNESVSRSGTDDVLTNIAGYVCDYAVESDLAYETARYCLMDALACALQALERPDCVRLLGPIVPGATLAGGARVPGTSDELDPVRAAFNIGTLVRWLDFNDTWLAAEWGHPSDNLGGILAVADYLSRQAVAAGRDPLTGRDLLTAMIKAYEVQGVIALENAFNRAGLDHVLLVRVASTAVVTAMLGGTRQQVVDAVSNAWIDGGALRTYRHAPNAGSRKGWAAGDATSRGVWHALNALRGEMGYASALSAPCWGFYDALFGGRPFRCGQPFGSRVIESILFKTSHPAEFHGQTAVECALQLHPQVRDRLGEVARVVIETQEPGMRILDKSGPLSNAADRDHCIRYVVAIPLIFGRLTAGDYEDAVAADPRVDALRARMEVRENPAFTADYYAPEKRHVGNAVEVFFADGSATGRIQVDVPAGHPRRRAEGFPAVARKFENSVAAAFTAAQRRAIAAMFEDRARLEAVPVSDLMARLVRA